MTWGELNEELKGRVSLKNVCEMAGINPGTGRAGVSHRRDMTIEQKRSVARALRLLSRDLDRLQLDICIETSRKSLAP